MTGRIGQVEGFELWLRCPFCGDSQNDPEKAHLSINLKKFIYHCFRCQASGSLTPKQAFQLMSSLSGDFSLDMLEPADDHDPDPEGWPELSPGAGSVRKSALDRYHYTDKNKIIWDAFYIRHPKDNTVSGVHLRYQKHRLIFGDKLFNWSYPGQLISTPEQPLRIVEGPYDVLYPEDVCTFGLISAKVLMELSGHYLVLCPDGDVWVKPDLFKVTVRSIDLLLRDKTKYLMGIEYLADGKDPDELAKYQRTYIPRTELKSFIESRWFDLSEGGSH